MNSSSCARFTDQVVRYRRRTLFPNTSPASSRASFLSVTATVTPLHTPDGYGLQEILVLERYQGILGDAVAMACQQAAVSKALVEDQVDVTASLTADFTFSYVSPSASTAWGFSPGSLLAQSLWSLVHPDDIEPLRGDFLAACSSKTSSLVRTYRRLTGTPPSRESSAGYVTDIIAVTPVMRDGELLHYNLLSRVLQLSSFTRTSAPDVKSPASSWISSDASTPFSSPWSPVSPACPKSLALTTNDFCLPTAAAPFASVPPSPPISSDDDLEYWATGASLASSASAPRRTAKIAKKAQSLHKPRGGVPLPQSAVSVVTTGAVPDPALPRGVCAWTSAQQEQQPAFGTAYPTCNMATSTTPALPSHDDHGVEPPLKRQRLPLSPLQEEGPRCSCDSLSVPDWNSPFCGVCQLPRLALQQEDYCQEQLLPPFNPTRPQQQQQPLLIEDVFSSTLEEWSHAWPTFSDENPVDSSILGFS